MARNNIVTENPAVSQGSFWGPFKSPDGDFYTLFHLAGFFPRIYKASDPLGGSWTRQDSAGEGTLSLPGGAWVHQDGNELLIATIDIADADLRFNVFNTSSDTWTTTDTLVHDPDNDADIGLKSCGIYKQTDGDLVIVSVRERDNVKGTRYNRVSYWRSTNGGTSWGSPIDIDDAGEVHYGGPVLHGVGNRVHVVYGSSSAATGAAVTGHHKTIRDADTLSSITNLAGGGADLFINGRRGVDYDDGGTQRVRMNWRVVTTNRTEILEFDDGDSPTITENVGVSDVAVRYAGGASQCLANDGTKVFLMYIDTVELDIFSDENDDDAGWGTDVVEETVTNAQQIWCNVFDNGGLVLAWVDEESSQLWYNEKSISAAAVEKEASDTLGLSLINENADLLGVIDVLDSLDLSISEVTEILGFLERTETVALSLDEAVNLLAILERVDTVDLAITDSSALVVVQTAIDTLNLSIVEVVTNLLGKADPVDTLDLALIEPTPEGESEGTAQDNLDLEVNEGVPDLLGRSSDQDVIDLEVIEGVGDVAAGITAEDDVDLDLTEGVTDLLGLIAPVDTTGLTVDEVQQILSLAERLDTLGISISEVTDLLGIISRTDLLDLSIEEVLAQIAVMVAGSDTLDLAITEGLTQVLVGVQVQDTLDLALIEITDLLGLIAGSDTVGLTIIEGVTFLFVRLDRTDILDLDLGEQTDLLAFIQAADQLDIEILDVADLVNLVQAADTLNISISEVSQVFNALSALDTLDIDLTEDPGEIVIPPLPFEGILVQPFKLQVTRVARFKLKTTRVARFRLQIEGSGEQRP